MNHDDAMGRLLRSALKDEQLARLPIGFEREVIRNVRAREGPRLPSTVLALIAAGWCVACAALLAAAPGITGELRDLLLILRSL
jgi:hypothetical protein